MLPQMILFIPLKHCTLYAVSRKSVKSRSRMLSSLFYYQKGPCISALFISYTDMNCQIAYFSTLPPLYIEDIHCSGYFFFLLTLAEIFCIILLEIHFITILTTTE